MQSFGSRVHVGTPLMSQVCSSSLGALLFQELGVASK